MFVVYFVAGEVMLVLQCIGYISGISDAMLGITFLAWGNSIGGELKFISKLFLLLLQALHKLRKREDNF